jgi:hypothetical protein
LHFEILAVTDPESVYGCVVGIADSVILIDDDPLNDPAFEPVFITDPLPEFVCVTDPVGV